MASFHNRIWSQLPSSIWKINVWCCNHCWAFIFNTIFIFTGNDSDNISDGYEILQDQIGYCGVSLPWVSWKTPIDGRFVVATVVSYPCATEKSMYIVVNTLAFLFEWIFLIPEGNKDNPKSLNELEFGPDPTTDCGDRKQNTIWAGARGVRTVAISISSRELTQ